MTVVIPQEHPILFSGPMVRAILEGRKTQTRRVVKNPERLEGLMLQGEEPDWSPYGGPGDHLWVKETHWQYGAWVTCRVSETETERHFMRYFHDDRPDERLAGVRYGAHKPDIQFSFTPPSSGGPDWFKRPSIFMPRWASRRTLEVLRVRVEQVRDISDLDCWAEGIDEDEWEEAEGYQLAGVPLRGGSPERCTFAALWDSINATPRPRTAGGQIVSYVSYPWDTYHPICEEKEWRGVPLVVHPNPWIWVTDFKLLEVRDARAA